MSKAKTFRYSCLSFVAGVGAASFLQVAVIYLFSAMAAFFVFAIIMRNKPTRRTVFLLSAFFLFGLWRLGISQPLYNENFIGYYNGKQVILKGQVAKEPLLGKSQQIALSVYEINGLKKEARGRVLLINPSYPRYHYGDNLEVECELKKPEPIEGFAYDRYLARYGVYSTCVYPKINVVCEKC
jgi:hypothetical protein